MREKGMYERDQWGLGGQQMGRQDRDDAGQERHRDFDRMRDPNRDYQRGPHGMNEFQQRGSQGYGQQDYSPGRQGQQDFGQRGAYGHSDYEYSSAGYGRSHNQSQGMSPEYGMSGYVGRSRSEDDFRGYGQSQSDQVGRQGGFAGGGGGNSGRGGYPQSGQFQSGQFQPGQQPGQGQPGRQRGEHFGKGPKGYQRSDERIKEEVCERLSRDPHIDASDITVEVKDSCVVLTGTVDGRDMKFHAEDLADDIIGVKDVQNNLRVRRPGEMGGQSQEQGQSQGGQQAQMQQGQQGGSQKMPNGRKDRDRDEHSGNII